MRRSGSLRQKQEIDALFASWRAALALARKYLPATRDYLAASLWLRVGLRISESVRLDIRDWRPDIGDRGNLHVRFGKGSRGRGPKPRLVPAINSVDKLMSWWLVDLRHQFGDDWDDPDASLLPSERRDPYTGRCTRAGDDALRTGLADAVGRWLPSWSGMLTPHGLRHFCESALYASGPIRPGRRFSAGPNQPRLARNSWIFSVPRPRSSQMELTRSAWRRYWRMWEVRRRRSP
jgi:integrase